MLQCADDKGCGFADTMKFARANIENDAAVDDLQIGKMNGVAAVHPSLAGAIGTHKPRPPR